MEPTTVIVISSLAGLSDSSNASMWMVYSPSGKPMIGNFSSAGLANAPSAGSGETGPVIVIVVFITAGS